MNCENCNKNHEGTYGSGRFCSSVCARGFSTKNKRGDINKKVSEKLKAKIASGDIKRPVGGGWKKGYDPRRRVFNDEDRRKAVIGYRKYQKDRLENTPFEKLSKDIRKRILIKDRGHQCEKCKNKEWLGHPIPLEIDHADGNNRNDVKENSRLFCPNCHVFTPTYRGRNITQRGKKVSDEDFISALKNTPNVRQALIRLELTPKAGNYERAYRLLQRW